MPRPLLISDCDEVLLHMVRHFADWLSSEHDIAFVPQAEDFSRSMHYRKNGEQVARDQMWLLLDGLLQNRNAQADPGAGSTRSAGSNRGDR
jgi:hypothetical protein